MHSPLIFNTFNHFVFFILQEVPPFYSESNCCGKKLNWKQRSIYLNQSNTVADDLITVLSSIEDRKFQLPRPTQHILGEKRNSLEIQGRG